MEKAIGGVGISTFTRTILIIIGSVSLALGILGVFLPLLPTTPFLLLAAACYSRSSEKFYNRLISNRLVGCYIKNYREGKGIPLRAKIVSMSLLWLTIGYTAIFVMHNVLIRIMLAVTAIGVTVHILRIKTCR